MVSAPGVKMDTRRIGRQAEEYAVMYLQEKGWRIIDRNWTCSEGELDIIAELGEELVFVEVKGRRSERYGGPESAVHERKRQHLRDAAWRYVLEHELEETLWRIDVIAVRMNQDGSLRQIDHYPYAVGEAG